MNAGSTLLFSSMFIPSKNKPKRQHKLSHGSFCFNPNPHHDFVYAVRLLIAINFNINLFSLQLPLPLLTVLIIKSLFVLNAMDLQKSVRCGSAWSIVCL